MTFRQNFSMSLWTTSRPSENVRISTFAISNPLPARRVSLAWTTPPRHRSEAVDPIACDRYIEPGTWKEGMAGKLRILLVGGPMYDPLYNRLGEFEEREGTKVETVVAPTHPDLNEQIQEEFGSGRASYDLISTHTKYAPSQRRWLTPLDEDLELSEIENFTPRTLELATHTIPDELWPELDSLVQFPLLATIDPESGSRRS